MNNHEPLSYFTNHNIVTGTRSIIPKTKHKSNRPRWISCYHRTKWKSNSCEIETQWKPFKVTKGKPVMLVTQTTVQTCLALLLCLTQTPGGGGEVCGRPAGKSIGDGDFQSKQNHQDKLAMPHLGRDEHLKHHSPASAKSHPYSDECFCWTLHHPNHADAATPTGFWCCWVFFCITGSR